MVEEILLVEPDFVWQEMLNRYLREWGADLRVCANGRQAMDAVASARPALAVVELELPDMAGLDLVRFLRRRRFLSGLPIVVLTQRRERSLVESALECSVNEYLIKSEHLPAQIAKRIAHHAGFR